MTDTIEQRLKNLGYGHCRDDLTPRDGRHMIYALGMPGYAIDRLNAKEAAQFCFTLENPMKQETTQ